MQVVYIPERFSICPPKESYPDTVPNRQHSQRNEEFIHLVGLSVVSSLKVSVEIHVFTTRIFHFRNGYRLLCAQHLDNLATL